MTTTALLAQVKARLAAATPKFAGDANVPNKAFRDDLAKLLAIVECMQAALVWYADCDEERTSEYAIAGLDKRARAALLAADKLASDE